MDVVCDLIETLFTPLLPATSGGIAPPSAESASTPDIVSPPTPESQGGKPDLVSLLGGAS
jgi:hypothetical protein